MGDDRVADHRPAKGVDSWPVGLSVKPKFVTKPYVCIYIHTYTLMC